MDVRTGKRPVWTASKSLSCGRSKSATCGSCACGSPTSWVRSSPWRWPRPRWKAPSRRAWASTAPRSRAWPASSNPTCWPSRIRPPSRSCRGAARPRPTSRMFCDILTPDGEPSAADPRNVLKRTLAKAADMGFTCYTHPEIEFYLLKSQEPGPDGSPDPGGRGRLLRPRPGRRGPGLPPDRRDHARIGGHLGGVQPPRGRPGPERDRPALRGRPADRGQHHDVPHGHQGGRAAAGHLRHLHAQALHRPPGLRHAHPLLALRGRHQRLLRGRRRVPALRDGAPVHRRHPQARPRIHGGDQPVRELLQAALGRGRGAELPELGPQQPLRPGPRPAVQARQGPVRADRIPRHRLRRQPLPGLRRAARRRASRASRRATSSPPRPRTTSGR